MTLAPSVPRGSNNLYIYWMDIYRFPPPEGVKLLLKRGDKIYAGMLSHKLKEKYYFSIDGGTNTIQRVVDYWAKIDGEHYDHG